MLDAVLDHPDDNVLDAIQALAAQYPEDGLTNAFSVDDGKFTDESDEDFFKSVLASTRGLLSTQGGAEAVGIVDAESETGPDALTTQPEAAVESIKVVDVDWFTSGVWENEDMTDNPDSRATRPPTRTGPDHASHAPDMTVDSADRKSVV